MTILNTRDLPEEFLSSALTVERVDGDNMTVLEMPAAVGWALQKNVRTPRHPLESHVCASSYDHLNLDLPPQRVAELYQTLPQHNTFVGVAGYPGQIGVRDAFLTLLEWGARPFASLGCLPEPEITDAYAAAPVFVLYRAGRSIAPLAIAGTRYRIGTPARGVLEVMLTLDSVAVAPQIRSQGVGHLIVLEAARWLGMLTSSMVLHGRRELQLNQQVHAHPVTARDEHLAEVFLKNYSYFTITDEMIEAARRDRELKLVQPGTRRYGLAAISRNLGVEDRIHSTFELELEAAIGLNRF